MFLDWWGETGVPERSHTERTWRLRTDPTVLTTGPPRDNTPLLYLMDLNLVWGQGVNNFYSRTNFLGMGLHSERTVSLSTPTTSWQTSPGAPVRVPSPGGGDKSGVARGEARLRKSPHKPRTTAALILTETWLYTSLADTAFKLTANGSRSTPVGQEC